MPRWIAFNSATQSALQSAVQTRAELRMGDALSLAFDSAERDAAAVALLPATPGEMLLVTIARPQPQSIPERPGLAADPPQKASDQPLDVARWEDPEALGYTASGFLGLLDEPVYQEEDTKPKKWWQKILE